MDVMIVKMDGMKVHIFVLVIFKILNDYLMLLSITKCTVKKYTKDYKVENII